jgi:hypothetical protein
MYTYEKFNIQLLPWFALILAIVFLFSKMYMEAGVSGAIGLLFCISYSGFNIDLQKGLVRHYDRFLWFYIGRLATHPPSPVCLCGPHQAQQPACKPHAPSGTGNRQVITYL